MSRQSRFAEGEQPLGGNGRGPFGEHGRLAGGCQAEAQWLIGFETFQRAGQRVDIARGNMQTIVAVADQRRAGTRLAGGDHGAPLEHRLVDDHPPPFGTAAGKHVDIGLAHETADVGDGNGGVECNWAGSGRGI